MPEKKIKKTNKAIIMQTISDVVKQQFSDKISIVVVVCSNKTNNEELDFAKKLDKNILSIAYASNLVEKYIGTFTSANVPAEQKKQIKVQYVFVKEFDEEDEKQTEKLLSTLNGANIVIISCDIQKISDYSEYYKFIDTLISNSKKINADKKNICNFFLAKMKNLEQLPLKIDVLNKFYVLPPCSISIWNGKNEAELRGNINGLENIDDINIMTMKESIDTCVENSVEYILLRNKK